MSLLKTAHNSELHNRPKSQHLMNPKLTPANFAALSFSPLKHSRTFVRRVIQTSRQRNFSPNLPGADGGGGGRSTSKITAISSWPRSRPRAAAAAQAAPENISRKLYQNPPERGQTLAPYPRLYRSPFIIINIVLSSRYLPQIKTSPWR